MIIAIKGVGNIEPVEVGRHHRLGSIDLSALQLTTSLSVVSHRPTKDHEVVVDATGNPPPLSLPLSSLGFFPASPLAGKLVKKHFIMTHSQRVCLI
jgi:hypothetical protein